MSVVVRPANEAACADLDAVFGSAGPGRCRCQRYKLARGEAFKDHPAAVRAARLREQTACGSPTAPATAGLVAHDADGTPVGWCAVEPRPAFRGLVRVGRLVWEGRDEDREDPSVWAVPCVLARAGHRRRGVGSALAEAAVAFARARGARALEAYPMRASVAFDSVLVEEMHVGTEGMFAAAGLSVVSRPGTRRLVMRVDF